MRKEHKYKKNEKKHKIVTDHIYIKWQRDIKMARGHKMATDHTYIKWQRDIKMATGHKMGDVHAIGS